MRCLLGNLHVMPTASTVDQAIPMPNETTWSAAMPAAPPIGQAIGNVAQGIGQTAQNVAANPFGSVVNGAVSVIHELPRLRQAVDLGLPNPLAPRGLPGQKLATYWAQTAQNIETGANLGMLGGALGEGIANVARGVGGRLSATAEAKNTATLGSGAGEPTGESAEVANGEKPPAVSVLMGQYGTDTAAQTGMVLPVLSAPEVRGLHQERLQNLGWDPATGQIRLLTDLGIPHVVVPERVGVSQGETELNARVLLPGSSPETQRYVAVLLGRKTLQDAVGIIRPNPNRTPNIIAVRSPSGEGWTPEDVAHFQRQVGTGFDLSTDGRFAQFIDYGDQGLPFFDTRNSAKESRSS